MGMKTLAIAAILGLSTALTPQLSAEAEAKEIRIAQLRQINYIPFLVMEEQGLFEKHAAELGEPELTAEFITFGNGSATTDALITGNVEYVAVGLTNFAILWARSRGDVKGVANVSGIPLPLLTRNPDIRSLEDFGPNDRIAVPTVGVSVQAIMLSMALERLYGPEGRDRLNAQTVQLSHSDAAIVLGNPMHEVNSHFSSAPYYIVSLRDPDVHEVFSNDELFDEPLASNILFTTTANHEANNVASRALIAALKEAHAYIADNKEEVAALYLERSGDPITQEEVVEVLNGPGVQFDVNPASAMPVWEFMADAGMLTQKPASWRDMFFEDVQAEIAD